MDRATPARHTRGMTQDPGSPHQPSPPPAGPPPPTYGGYQQAPGGGYQQPPGSYAPPGYPAPTEMAPDQQRLWACLAHLSPIVASVVSVATGGTFYTGALGPLIIFLVLKERGLFVRRQSVEALNFQILFTIIYLVGILLGVVTLGIGLIITVPILVVLGIVFLVFQIIAAVKANQGVDYRYPFNWRLVR